MAGLFDLPQYFGRHACYDSIVGYVLRYDGSGCNDGIFANRYSRQYHRTRADPCVATDDYGLDQQPMSQGRFFGVVLRQNLRSRPDEYTVFERDAALVEERAIEIDKYIFAHTGRLSESRIERREQAHGGIQRLSPNTFEQRPHFVGRR